MPKLQTACSTVCADGMVVDTRSPEVAKARAVGVRVPAASTTRSTARSATRAASARCRTSPTTFGPAASRMDFPRRVFDGEGVKGDVDFGPTLLLNRNRCILCTRCVRFMKRGGRRRPDLHPGPRQRQPDRDVPGGRRPLAHQRQPDGRLPGGRDHDAGLPVQVAAVGQPGGGGHDLHAVLEGLQHHRRGCAPSPSGRRGRASSA